jgi:hypothetical protein
MQRPVPHPMESIPIFHKYFFRLSFSYHKFARKKTCLFLTSAFEVIFLMLGKMGWRNQYPKLGTNTD